MKHTPLVLIFVLLFIFAATQAAAQSTVEPAAGVSAVAADSIFVRAGPGLAHTPIGRLEQGDIVNPVSRNDNGDWIMIRYNSGFGWIRRDLALWAVDVASLPVLTDDDLTPTPEPGAETPVRLAPTGTPEGNWVDVEGVGAFHQLPQLRPVLLFQVASELPILRLAHHRARQR